MIIDVRTMHIILRYSILHANSFLLDRLSEESSNTSSRQAKRAGRSKIAVADLPPLALHLQLFSFTSIKQRTRHKTGLPRDLLYMQIKDGYGGNRGMWWRLTETRYRQVSSVKRPPSSFPPSSNLRVFRLVEDLSLDARHMCIYIYITQFVYILLYVIFIFWIILTKTNPYKYVLTIFKR